MPTGVLSGGTSSQNLEGKPSPIGGGGNVIKNLSANINTAVFEAGQVVRLARNNYPAVVLKAYRNGDTGEVGYLLAIQGVESGIWTQDQVKR